jgi:hypothetical protein
MTDEKQRKNKGWANLIPCKPGQSGNPKGRPSKPKCIPDLLRWAGGLKCPENMAATMRVMFGVKGDLTVEQALILRSIAAGLKGDIKHIEFWAERTEGKSVQPLDVTNRGPLVAIISPPVIDVKT